MALLQDNEDFWAENPPHPSAMDQQDPARRNKLAMQMFLRLHILVACQGIQEALIQEGCGSCAQFCLRQALVNNV